MSHRDWDVANEWQHEYGGAIGVLGGIPDIRAQSALDE
jgi:hypothetical protein